MDEGRTLIVDTDPETRNLIVKTFQSFGYTSRVAADGLEALGLVQKEKFDIVVCEIRMPGLDGLELIARVRQMMHEMPFVFITGYSQEYSYESIIKAGAHDFIRKPFTNQELHAKLNRILKEIRLAKENRRLYEDQIALNEKLLALLAVARDLTAEHDFHKLFHLIIGKVTEVMDAERSSLYIIDWERREIWTLVAENIKQIRLPLGEGISGQVADTGKMINVTDAWQLPYFNREFDLKNNFRTKSVLCLPINNRKGDRVGVIQVINKKNEPFFNKNDVFVLESLASQVAITLENSSLVKELQLSFEGFIRTISATVDAKDPLTAGHSHRVTDYSLMIGRDIGLGHDELEAIKYAALLHDVGKIGIRDSVLLKNGPFTSAERAEMNTHPLKTRSILENFRFPDSMRDVPLIASQHHEKVNGQGYPYGLEDDKISLGAKILAVADVFDALTSPRHYPKYTKDEVLGREAMPIPKAVSILKDEADTHFDPKIVAAFLRCLPQVVHLLRETNFPSEYLEDSVLSLI